MDDSNVIKFLVCWKQQKRFIELKSNDDLDTIRKSILNVYRIPDSYSFDKNVTIQYYNRTYEEFIDLYSDTLSDFHTLLQDLSRSNTSSVSKQFSTLKIVQSIAIPCASDESDQSSMDIDSPHSKIGNILTESVIQPIPDIVEKEPALAAEPANVVQPVMDQYDDPGIPNRRSAQNNPLNLHFDRDLDRYQRKQYECEIERIKKKTQEASAKTIGGVLLKSSSSTNHPNYPLIRFNIPEETRNNGWCLYVYLLTQKDPDNIHYLHASKGIYDATTNPSARFGQIPLTKLVNPYVIELSKDDIELGEYKLRVRICNTRNLILQKQNKLQRFPEIGYFVLRGDTKLISKYTTNDLNFASEEYHVGCTLVSNYRISDRCVSNLVIADQHKKKRRSDKSKE